MVSVLTDIKGSIGGYHLKLDDIHDAIHYARASVELQRLMETLPKAEKVLDSRAQLSGWKIN